MVFFSCDKCAETLKKNKVDAHAIRCGCDSVSCVDCSVSFWGDDYKQHTSCISEAERYEKTVYKGPRKNDTQGRKLTPQEVWTGIIHDSLQNCPSTIASYLESLSSYDNVPRKEKAFRNFATNSLNLRGPNGNAIITSIWNHLSSLREERLKSEEANRPKETAPKNDEGASEKSGNSESNPITCEEKVTKDEPTPFKPKKVAKAMKKALKKAPSKQMEMKELRKLVQKKLEADVKEVKKKELKKAIVQIIAEDISIKSDGKTVKLVQ